MLCFWKYLTTELNTSVRKFFLTLCVIVCLFTPSTLEGVSFKGDPYYLGIEADVMEHWGEHISEERAVSLGLPTGVRESEGNVVNYT